MIRTGALELTLTYVAVPGLLVLVRTMLSWSLAVEMEGGWSWQAKAETPSAPWARRERMTIA